MKVESALVIDSPWIDMILRGEKVWELRSRNSKRRGVIGLARKGTGLILGTARMIDVKGPLTLEELEQAAALHRVPMHLLSGPLAKYRMAWVMSDAKKLETPVPYRHTLGAVIFVNLHPDSISMIHQQIDRSQYAPA